MKLQQMKNQYIITVPSQIVRAKGWEKHQVLKWEINKQGNLELIEKSQH